MHLLPIQKIPTLLFWLMLYQNNISINVNTTDKTLLIAMTRTDLITNTEFPNNTLSVGVVGALGGT
jgi:hypothetical protein